MRLIGPIAALPLLIVPSASTNTSVPRDHRIKRDARVEVHPGERWIRVLEDQKAGKFPLVAVQELGRLRYAPAIPVLLKYAAQEGVSACDFGPLWADCPCITALRE